MSDNNNEINITLFHPPTSKTDAIAIDPHSTTLGDLSNFAMALLGLDCDDDGGVVLAKGQSRLALYHPHPTNTNNSNNNANANANANTNNNESTTLATCGIVDGDFLSAYTRMEFQNLTIANSTLPTRQPPSRSNNGNNNNVGGPAGGAAGGAGGGAVGGLDFSALLGGGSSARPSPALGSGSGGGVVVGGGGGGMDFTALLSAGNAATSSSGANSSASSTPASSQPVQWDGMNLDDAILRNSNPIHLMTILSDTTRHPNILKELNYHNPQVCKKLLSANGDIPKMAEIWRQTMMKSTTARFLQNHLKNAKELEMRNALRLNPMDAEANKYFGEKIRLDNVQRQYEQMIEEYPESMGRVLMLYVNCLVNKKPLQAFVDSGAQNTIMSSACADRLGLLHMVDNRFAGTAVGVGTGKILGKIHMVELTIGGYDFPCSITVMDSDAGLGDKNMDCLFGLDMLKRHRCCIDLAKNVLRFAISGGSTMEAPFLHEKDLPTSKGGTMGFDAERENAEMEARREKMETEEEDGRGKKEEEDEDMDDVQEKSGGDGEGK